MLGHDAAMRHRQRLALNLQNAIDQHQRLVWQAHARRESIGGGELLAEHLAHVAAAEFEAGSAIQRTWNASSSGRRYRRGREEVIRARRARPWRRRRSAKCEAVPLSDYEASAFGQIQHPHLCCHRLRQRGGHVRGEAQECLVRFRRSALRVDRSPQHSIFKAIFLRHGSGHDRLRNCGSQRDIFCRRSDAW